MSKKIVLIDGNSIMNRAFYGIPTLTNAEGLHTNAVYGFLNIMFKFIDEAQAEYILVAFDRKDPTFRHEMFSEYKATRTGMPDELREQMPVIKEVLQAMNIIAIEKSGYEADDILGTIAKHAEAEGYDVSVVSGDRDLLQLATNKIQIRIPKTKMSGTEVEDYYEADVIEKLEVTPTQFIDVKGLMGDTSDNIPGLPGVGPKTATKIIAEFKSIENAYAHIEEVKPNKAKQVLAELYEQAIMSKKLATIKTDCELEYNLNDTKINNLYNENSYKLFKQLEFKKLLARFENSSMDITNQEINIEKAFKCVTYLDEAEQVFLKVAQESIIAIELVAEECVVGVSLCSNEKEIYFIKSDSVFITEEYIKSKCESLINEGNKNIILMDLKKHLKHLEIHPNKQIFDMFISAYLLNPLTENYEYDDIAKHYLNITIPSQKELIGKNTFQQTALLEEDKLLQYACYKVYVAYAAQECMKNKLIETDMLTLFDTIEMPLIYVLSSMEKYGIKVNENTLVEYSKKLQERITELEEQIYKQADTTFNINSPKQLGEVLFDKLKLPYGKKTKTGYSTSADVLEKLSVDYPIVKLVLEYRQFSKLKSTYADGLVHYIEKDKRIHGTFNQTITATGRISSTDPNLQNIPIRIPIGREIRKAFVSEENYLFIDADYSQIELRVLAHISGDEMLIKAYSEAQDIHTLTASQVFHVPEEEVTDLQRRNAKAVNFGIVYGISTFGLSQDLSITRKEAETYIKQYFKTYPKIKEFLDNIVIEAKDKGFVKTIYGRIRPIPELKSSNYMQRSFGERVAMNSPIQGSAADIIKMAMIQVNNTLINNHMKSRLILQVHDELLIEAHVDEVEEIKKILIEEMENVVKLKVPLTIDINTGTTWYDSK